MSSEINLDDGLMERLCALHEVFYPRAVWATPSFYSASELDRTLVTLLYALIEQKQAKLSYSAIPWIQVDRWDWNLPIEDRELLEVAAGRRGYDDLKDETWSGLVQLRNRYPGRNIEPRAGELPIGYFEPVSKTFVTAGNCSPTRLLEFILRRGARTLEMVGPIPDEESERVYANLDKAAVGLTTLTLTGKARELLRDAYNRLFGWEVIPAARRGRDDGFRR